MSVTWSLGVLVWLPIAILITVALAVLFVLSLRWDDYEATIVRWGVGGVLVCFVIGNLVFFYPYSAEYHRYQPITGEIDLVAKRIVGGDSISEKFVVRYKNGEERGCLDTRCALLKPGDTLTLKCKRVWQYTGTDGWDCTYVGRESA